MAGLSLPLESLRSRPGKKGAGLAGCVSRARSGPGGLLLIKIGFFDREQSRPAGSGLTGPLARFQPLSWKDEPRPPEREDAAGVLSGKTPAEGSTSKTCSQGVAASPYAASFAWIR